MVMTIEPTTARNTANVFVFVLLLLLLLAVALGDQRDSRPRLKMGVNASQTQAAVGVVERSPNAYNKGYKYTPKKPHDAAYKYLWYALWEEVEVEVAESLLLFSCV